MGPMSRQEVTCSCSSDRRWRCGLARRDYIDPALTAILTVLLMVVSGVVSWDDVIGQKQAWNVLIWFGDAGDAGRRAGRDRIRRLARERHGADVHGAEPRRRHHGHRRRPSSSSTTSLPASRRTRPRCCRCSSRWPSRCRHLADALVAAARLSSRPDGLLTFYAAGQSSSTTRADTSAGAISGCSGSSWACFTS